MSSKVPKVSVIGSGGNRSGFEKLPESDPAGAVSLSAAQSAARKSRRHKNIIAIKIGLVILSLSAILAGLTAFFLSRGGSNTDIVTSFRASRAMSVDISDAASMRSLASATEMFSRTLFKELAKEKTGDDNLLMSPYSASLVLSMAASGAGGDTRTEMMTGLHLPDTETAGSGWSQVIPALRSNENFTLESANAAFTMKDYEVLASYRESLHTIFHSDISPVNFGEPAEAAQTINSWVSDMTNKKIDKLIEKDMVNGNTRLVLVNALYFKGDWEKKFDKKNTAKDKFFLQSGEDVMADMMVQEAEIPYAVLDNIDSTIVELPYKGDRIVMQIVLPNKKSGLRGLEEKIDSVDIADIFRQHQRNTKVRVKMPKFKLSSSAELSDPLQAMGMARMFDATVADFSGIDGTRTLFVDFVKQEVAIEVNEEGSEAAAATGMGMMMRSMPLPPEQFTVDHPFLFYIRDKLTGMLLFQGRISNPTLD